MATFNPHLFLQTYSGEWPLIKLGDSGWWVKLLRRALAHEFPLDASLRGEVSDKFDDKLKATVQVFQRQQGLVADGAVGDLTWTSVQHVSYQNKPVAPVKESGDIRDAEVARARQVLAKGIYERKGHPNRSPEIDAWNQNAGVSLGSPYCVTSWNAELPPVFAAHGRKIPFLIGASSSRLVDVAHKAGRLKPASAAKKGDLGVVIGGKGRKAFDGRPRKHTFFIESVNPDGTVVTIECNTNKKAKVGAGVSDGDGVYRGIRDPHKTPFDVVDLVGS